MPLDASRLRRVNVEHLESGSVAGSQRTRVSGSAAEEDSLSVDASSLSQGESGYIEGLAHDYLGTPAPSPVSNSASSTRAARVLKGRA